MTVKELSQLYYINREIAHDQRRLEELRSKAYAPQSPQLDGMPHGSGSAGSRTEWIADEIVDLEAIIAAKQIQCIHERQRLERYIADVPDSLTRMILTLRFVDVMPWDQVADKIGGGNTTEGVKKRCYRYLKCTDEDSEEGTEG